MPCEIHSGANEKCRSYAFVEVLSTDSPNLKTEHQLC